MTKSVTAVCFIGLLPNEALCEVLSYRYNLPDYSRFSRVCRLWRACIKDPRFKKNIFPLPMELCFFKKNQSDSIQENKNVINKQELVLLKKTYLGICEVFLDTSGSMADLSNRKILSDKAINRTKAVIHKCQPFLKQIQLYTFSKDVALRQTISEFENFKSIRKTLDLVKKNCGGFTEISFLVDKLNQYKKRKDTKKLIREFIISDLNLKPEQVKLLIDTIKKLREKDRITLCFIEVRTYVHEDLLKKALQDLISKKKFQFIQLIEDTLVKSIAVKKA